METTVLHLVNRFAIGGAERQFIERLRAHPAGFRPLVGCLEISGGNVDDFLQLGLEPPRIFPTRGSLLRPNTLVQVGRIAALIRKERVRIVGLVYAVCPSAMRVVHQCVTIRRTSSAVRSARMGGPMYSVPSVSRKTQRGWW